MAETIICPQCKHENKKSAIFCDNCGAILAHLAPENPSDQNWFSLLRADESNDEDNLIEPTSGDAKQLFSTSEEPDNEEPEWLKRIREVKEADEGYTHIVKQTELSQTNTAMNEDELLYSTESKHEDSDSSNDWLNEFRKISENSSNDEQNSGESDQEPVIQEDSETLSSIENIRSDWHLAFPEQLGLEEVEGVAPAEEFPEWLNLNQTISEDEINDNQQEPHVPEWLSSGYRNDDEDEFNNDNPSQIPEWLSKTNFLHEEKTLSEKEEEDPNKLPDWIQEINQKFGISQEASEIPQDNSEVKQPQKSTPESLLDRYRFESKSSETPENQPNEDSPSQDKAIESAFLLSDEELNSLPVEPFISFEDFMNEEVVQDKQPSEDEINDLSVNHDFVIEEKDNSTFEIPPFNFGEVPDWLENIDFHAEKNESVDTDEIESKPQQEIPENIEKATLPEWLKAIRPIEVITPDPVAIKTQQQKVLSGPLAGLEGVLSSESVTKSYTPPPTYSVSIDVSDKQKKHLKLLQEIISPPTTTSQSSKKKKSILELLESFIIPLFLILIIVTSLFTDHSAQRLPQIIPAETLRFYNLATSYLSRNQEPSQVLVVFEADASSYPELNLISKRFFENMYENNHGITIVSTNPHGALLATQILDNTKQKVPKYKYNEKIHNLGYLPGNIVGIQSFLSQPKDTLTGLEVGINVWDSTDLSNINSISDFNMIVLMTDNSDKAKLWVEQINLSLPNSNFLIVATIKAAPLLQPYLEANQVDGMMSGILGGISYDLLSTAETSELSRFLAINQLSVVIFILFILAGGVVAIFSKSMSSSQSEESQK